MLNICGKFGSVLTKILGPDGYFLYLTGPVIVHAVLSGILRGRHVAVMWHPPRLGRKFLKLEHMIINLLWKERLHEFPKIISLVHSCAHSKIRLYFYPLHASLLLEICAPSSYILEACLGLFRRFLQ
jgi:hypothetical protein